MIGNIVSDSPGKYDNRINLVNSIDNIIEGLPTLIVGYDLTKELFPKDFNILERELKYNFYWTYSLFEKRSYYDVNIEYFTQYCYDNTIIDINYVFVDPIQFNLNTLKKVINKIYTLKNPIPFIYHDYIYIYGENIIFGLDLHLYEFFFNVKKNKIKNKINILSNGLLLDENILIEYKDYLDRLNTIKYIPFLYYIDNGPNNSSSIIHTS
jgi:hypothetical protein